MRVCYGASRGRREEDAVNNTGQNYEKHKENATKLQQKYNKIQQTEAKRDDAAKILAKISKTQQKRINTVPRGTVSNRRH